MDIDYINNKLRLIVSKYTLIEALDTNTPLTSSPYFMEARSLAAIFLEIEKEFNVDLDEVFDRDIDYSINSIASAVFSLQSR